MILAIHEATEWPLILASTVYTVTTVVAAFFVLGFLAGILAGMVIERRIAARVSAGRLPASPSGDASQAAGP